jgi:hypothetical protein
MTPMGAPDTPALVNGTFDATLGLFNQAVVDLWPYLVPWLTLRVGLELFFWWLGWRAAKKQPRQLALF